MNSLLAPSGDPVLLKRQWFSSHDWFRFRHMKSPPQLCWVFGCSCVSLRQGSLSGYDILVGLIKDTTFTQRIVLPQLYNVKRGQVASATMRSCETPILSYSGLGSVLWFTLCGHEMCTNCYWFSVTQLDKEVAQVKLKGENGPVLFGHPEIFTTGGGWGGAATFKHQFFQIQHAVFSKIQLLEVRVFILIEEIW